MAWDLEIFQDFLDATGDGLFLEFGVSVGESARKIANAIYPGKLYGFDWFKGLPEDWGPHMPKGSFAAEPPDDIANLVIVNGLFQDTLPGFLKQHQGPISFVHIDCDLYSSTKYVLDTIGHRLRGAVLMFDECWNNDICEEHEGRAFKEFLAESGLKEEFIGYHHGNGAGYRILS